MFPLVNPLEVVDVNEHDLDGSEDAGLLLDGAVDLGGGGHALGRLTENIHLLAQALKHFAGVRILADTIQALNKKRKH